MLQLEISRLSHQFADGTFGIRDLDLSIERGEFVVIAGANGSGKTTLCRHLNGLLTPSSGGVWLEGRSVEKNLRWARQQVGMVFQDADSQIVGETVAADIAFGLENLRLPRSEIEARVRQVADRIGLMDRLDHRPHTLSGGEKRRLAIAGVLAMQPAVLVLDEPFANLDFPGCRQVRQLMDRLHRDGHTVIVVSHAIDDVADSAGRLVIMQHGTIVRDGTPDGLWDELEDFDIKRPCRCRFEQEERR
jgi:biotin transport system ATP-binding protein